MSSDDLSSDDSMNGIKLKIASLEKINEETFNNKAEVINSNDTTKNNVQSAEIAKNIEQKSQLFFPLEQFFQNFVWPTLC